MSRFWPVSQAAQADYERLRAAVVSAGALPDDLVAARFGRRGLAGLIAWPAADPLYMAEVIGATRPAWSPYADPRLMALAGVYRLVLSESDRDRSSGDDGVLMVSPGARA